jgi:Tol biopolymer transport system component
MTDSRLCPYCNEEHPEDSLFCPRTGKRLSGTCPECGFPVVPAWLNCAHCGLTLVQLNIDSSIPKKKPVVIPPVPGVLQKALKIRIGLRTVVGLVMIEVFFFLLILVAYKLSPFTPIAHGSTTNQPKVTPVKTFSPMPVIQAKGRIAFVSNRDGNSEIYVMNADGSGQTRLTKSDEKVNNDYPAWSPDGKKIAFVSDRDGNAEIYVMNTDGSLLIRLTNNKAGDYFPTWSPDGQKIAFVSDQEGAYKVCMLNSDGSDPMCLKNTELGNIYLTLGESSGVNSTHHDEIGISWSMDGQKIIYDSYRSGFYKFYVINVTTGNQFDLAKNSYCYDPQWSPDGLKIAYWYYPNNLPEVYIMDSNGINQRPITHWEDKTNAYAPTWAPDSQKIAFVSNRDGNEEIYVMNADGGYQTRLTDNQEDDWNPSWTG